MPALLRSCFLCLSVYFLRFRHSLATRPAMYLLVLLITYSFSALSMLLSLLENIITLCVLSLLGRISEDVFLVFQAIRSTALVPPYEA